MQRYQLWTELMYPEYLLQRGGGPAKFQAIVNGTPGAWVRSCRDHLA